MRNIMIGFLLVFLDFNLNINASKIGLLPDFIGYIIMGKGLLEMAGDSSLFMKAKPFVSAMAVYSGILYFMDLFGMSVSLGGLSYILSIISVFASLYISYQIVMGVVEMEAKYNINLNAANLRSTWIIFACFNVMTPLSILVPLITLVFIIISFILAICFLISFNRSKNLYYHYVD